MVVLVKNINPVFYLHDLVERKNMGQSKSVSSELLFIPFKKSYQYHKKPR